MDDPFLFHHLLIFQSHPILLHSIWRSEKNQIVNIPYLLKIPFVLHVEQKGSLVNKEYLRFDFSHYAKLSEEELDEIEKLVNDEIRKGHPLIEERNIPLLLAKEKGAMMLFGEKYGDSVRTIQFGESIELSLIHI